MENQIIFNINIIIILNINLQAYSNGLSYKTSNNKKVS